MPPPEISSDATPQPRLRRLPGRSPMLRFSRAVVNARLWVDERQIVQETVRGHRQEIQRFAFADLQAIQIRRTARGWVYSLTLALLLILLASVLAAKGSPLRDHLVLAAFCGVTALLLFLNLARGSTCHTVLLTALGPQRLFSLSRTRQACRALDTITAGVDAVQGGLPPEEAARLVDQARR